jgi:hypothetical protein
MEIAIVLLLAVHGLVHLIGFLATWGLARPDSVSRAPTNLFHATFGSPFAQLLGLVWLVALAAFLTAAVLLIGDDAAWRFIAVAGVGVSMPLVALWWRDAPIGAVANALVLVAVLAAPVLPGVPA